MSLGHLLTVKLHQQQSPSVVAMNQKDVFMGLSRAFSDLEKATGILDATKYNLTTEEVRFAQHSLNSIPQEFQPSTIRMEAYAATTDGLKLRVEGIIDSIIGGIKKFFEWIANGFKSLFGGGDSASPAGGAPGAASVATAVGETTSIAASNGVDEFLFKADSHLFKILDLGNLSACNKYYDSIVASTKAVIDIQKSAIEFSKKGGKEYQGDFRKDALVEMQKVIGNKSDSYAKGLVRSNDLKDGTYFAFPVAFNTARVLVVTEQGVTTPSDSTEKAEGDQVGEGYTPKDVYIPAAEFKRLVDHFSQSTKLFYDRDNEIKALASGFETLSKSVDNWKAMEPETAKLVGEGLRELNKIANYCLKVLEIQKTNLNKTVAILKSVNENDLRDQAKSGRKKDADDADAKKKAEENKGADQAKGKERLKELQAKGDKMTDKERAEMKRLRAQLANGKF